MVDAPGARVPPTLQVAAEAHVLADGAAVRATNFPGPGSWIARFHWPPPSLTTRRLDRAHSWVCRHPAATQVPGRAGNGR